MSKSATSTNPYIGLAAGQEYTTEEVEFIKAMDKFMMEKHRKYPAFTEVLAVAKRLGYKHPNYS